MGGSSKQDIIPHRNIRIFKPRLITCDFIVGDLSNLHNCIMIELWGYSDRDKSKIAIAYQKRKQEKISLYKQYNYKLISINIEDIKHLNSKKLNKYFLSKIKYIKG